MLIKPVALCKPQSTHTHKFLGLDWTRAASHVGKLEAASPCPSDCTRELSTRASSALGTLRNNKGVGLACSGARLLLSGPQE